MRLLSFFLVLTGSLFAIKDMNTIKEEIGRCIDPSVYQYIQNKLDSAAIISVPFPHLIVEDFLPEDLYDHALQEWPAHDQFKLQSNSRQFLWVNFGCLKNSQLPFRKQVFWQTFGEVIMNRFTKPALAEKFRKFINIKFQTNDQKTLQQIEQDIEFWEHRQDGLVAYPAINQLKAHVDECNVFIQILLYFPEDNEHQEIGTLFYSGNPTSLHKKYPEKEENLQLVKKIPYKRNTLVVFLQSPISWHSVKSYSYPDQNYLRQLYLASVSLTPESIDKIYGKAIPFSPLDLYAHEYSLLYADE